MHYNIVLASTGQSSGHTVAYSVCYGDGDHTVQHVASQSPGHQSDGHRQPVETQIQRKSFDYPILTEHNLIICTYISTSASY